MSNFNLFEHQRLQKNQGLNEECDAIKIKDKIDQCLQEVNAYLGLGANVGERFEYLQAAINKISHTPEIIIQKCSSIYETEPVGYKEQNDFLNMVVAIRTTLLPHQLLNVIFAVEQELNRKREMKWGPRTIDIDILSYATQTLRDDRLELPHPRIKERLFVLYPLREVISKEDECVLFGDLNSYIYPLEKNGYRISKWEKETLIVNG